MNCEVFYCHKEIIHGNLVALQLIKQDILTGVAKKVTMLVSVCDDCIKRHKGEHLVKGEIDIKP